MSCDSHMTWVQGSSGGVRQWRVNSQAVERCVADVVKIAKELNSDESRYFQAVSSLHTRRHQIYKIL